MPKRVMPLTDIQVKNAKKQALRRFKWVEHIACRT